MNLSTSMNYWGIAPPMQFEELTYEEKRKFRYDLQDYQKPFFQFEKFSGKNILEIGSGAGIDSCEFARNGAKITCIDFTEIAPKLTNKLISQYGGNSARTSATLLPFRNESFDVVYSFGVIHHIPQIDDVLNEIMRVLKPGGLFMGMVYNKNSLLYAYLLYYFGIKEGLSKQMSEEEIISKYSERREGCPYTRVFTTEELESLFLSHGLKIEEVDVFYDAMDIPGYKRKIKIDFDDKNLSLGWHIGFKARKS